MTLLSRMPGDGRWLETQRLGLVASAVLAGHGRSESALAQHALGLRKARHLAFELQCLPPLVLRLFDDALARTGLDDELREEVSAVRQEMNQGGSLFASNARLIAFHILSGRASAERLLRLGIGLRTPRGVKRRSVYWKKLARNPDALERIDGQLRRIRATGVSTSTLVEAVAALGAELRAGTGGAHQFICQIENQLIPRCFAWPILVLYGDDVPPLALGLPIAVDLTDDPSQGVSVEGTSAQVDARAWEESLERSLRIANELIAAKAGDSFVPCGARFDFSWTGRILAGAEKFGIRIEDRSAEAYLATAVMQRHLKQSATVSWTILGYPEPDAFHTSHNPYYHLAPLAEDVTRLKLDYVRRSRLFERAIVPSDAYGSHDQEIDCQEAKTLYDVAHLTLGPAWRQERYVRCPELAWGFHSKGRPGLLRGSPPAVGSILAAIRSCSGSVLRLPAASGRAVGTALMRIRRRHPSASWLMLRPLAEEQDTWFWDLVFHGVGARPGEFEGFCALFAKEPAITAVADLLNQLEPTPDEPGRRAPIFLVVLGSNAFGESLEGTVNPDSHPYAPELIFRALDARQMLQPAGDPELREEIGGVRVILVGDETPLPRHAQRERTRKQLERLAPIERDALIRLAAFPGEFLFADACSALRGLAEHDEVDRLLRGRVGRLLGKLGDAWYVPAATRNECPRRARPLDRATDLFAVGRALAPFQREAGPEPQPQRLHESVVCLQNAMLEGKKAPESDERSRLVNEARNLAEDLGSFVVTPNPGLLTRLLNGSRPAYAYTIAREILERRQGAAVHEPLYPSVLVSCARAAAFEYQSTGDPALLFEVQQWLREARASCKTFQKHGMANTLHVLAWTAVLHAQLGLDEPNHLETLNLQIWRTIEGSNGGTGTALVPGRWWEQFGNSIPDHAKAAEVFLRGVEHVPDWQNNIIGALGALRLAGNPEADVRVEELGATAVLDLYRGADLMVKKLRKRTGTPGQALARARAARNLLANRLHELGVTFNRQAR